jgi:oligopeptide/dipeptide ABC transporter ATP-binding protein
MVMYAGRAIETGTTHEIFYETRHPYTLGLLASLPRLDDVGDEPLVPIVGSPPSLIRKPSGCSFHPRCRFARVPGNCETDDPALRLVAGDDHQAACHYAEELADVSVESLRTAVDVTAETALDLALPRDREPIEDAAVVEDVAVAEATAHSGVTDRAEGQIDQWPATGQRPDDGEANR